jgi:hypothetical protein
MSVALAMSVLATAIACSSGEGSAPSSASTATSTADSQAEALVRSSAATTKNLTSSHVLIQLQGKFDRFGQASVVDGDAQTRPLVMNGQVTYTNGEVAPLVIANDMVSVKLSGVWNEVGQVSSLVPPAIIDPSQGLPSILESIEAPQPAGSEVIGGVDTTKVTGTMPADQAQDLLQEASGPADFTVWIRKNGDPVLVRTAIGLSPQQSITITLSNWNVPVQVSATPAP